MRELLAVLLVVGTIQTAAEEVTFVRQVPKVGQTRTETEETSMDMKMSASVGGQVVQNVEQKQSESILIRSTVTTVNEKAVTGVRAECVQAVRRVTDEEGKLQELPSPCQGKTYVVKVKADGHEVTYENGDAPPAEELDWVKEQFKSLGREDSFDGVLAGKTVKVGGKLDISAEEAATLLDVKDAGLKVEKFDLTLKAVRAQGASKHAVFDAVITMSQAQGGLKMTIDMAGELVIDAASCWPIAIQIKGPLKAAGQQVEQDTTIELNGSGMMAAKMGYEYGP